MTLKRFNTLKVSRSSNALKTSNNSTNLTRKKRRDDILNSKRRKLIEPFYNNFNVSFILSHSVIPNNLIEQQFVMPDNIRLIQFVKTGATLLTHSVAFIYDKILDNPSLLNINENQFDHYLIYKKKNSNEVRIFKPLIKLKITEPTKKTDNLFLYYDNKITTQISTYKPYGDYLPNLRKYIGSGNEYNFNFANLFNFIFYEQQTKTAIKLKKLFQLSVNNKQDVRHYISNSHYNVKNNRFIMSELLRNLSQYYKSRSYPKNHIVTIVQLGCMIEDIRYNEEQQKSIQDFKNLSRSELLKLEKYSRHFTLNEMKEQQKELSVMKKSIPPDEYGNPNYTLITNDVYHVINDNYEILTIKTDLNEAIDFKNKYIELNTENNDVKPNSKNRTVKSNSKKPFEYDLKINFNAI